MGVISSITLWEKEANHTTLEETLDSSVVWGERESRPLCLVYWTPHDDRIR